MKIVAISDTHLIHETKKIPIPDGDVLVHAGDATWYGEFDEIEKFARWFGSQPHEYKLFVAGNHDWLFQKRPQVARGIMAAHGIIYLEDLGYTVNGVRFYGSPWQPEFNKWAFNLPRGSALANAWSRIPEDTDVLITHGPPFGYGDQIPGGLRVGCEELIKRVERIRPRVHIFGHVHCGFGQYTRRDLGIRYFNVAMCDDGYNYKNDPVEIDL